MSEIKLKPCPFCGSKAELLMLIVPGKMTKWAVRCTTCYENNGTFVSDHDAVEAWNKRAELPSSQPEQRWIPCSKRLPPELKPVNVTWINRQPPTYYENLKDKPFTDTAVIYEGKWYWQSAVCVDLLKEYGESPADDVEDAIDIVAWMPLPEPYEEVNRMNDLISRQDALEAIHTWDKFGVDALGRVVRWYEGLEPYVHLRDVVRVIENMPSAQPELIRCKDCEYGEQDEIGRWFCNSLGCQVGNEDGSGYCADAERRTDE